jgi:hypothetical protein
MAKLPRDFSWVFWDVDFNTLDTGLAADFILARILEFGRHIEVRWLVDTYGLDRIHQFLRMTGHPELSERTLQFWRAVFHAESEQWASPPAWRRSSSAPWID